MALERPTKTVTRGTRTWILTRPGRGGIARIARRIAQATDNGMGAPSLAVVDLDGAGIEMEAILAEYLTSAPDDWRAQRDGKPANTASGTPLWAFDDCDAGEFAEVGEEARAYHRTFRDVDARFGTRPGQPS